jgi:hypothetical protein
MQSWKLTEVLMDMSLQPSRDDYRLSLIAQYLKLTREVMPDFAKRVNPRWPVSEDHCFQRIVLDNICGGVWYDSIKQPAYKYLDITQAENAVELCNRILSGNADLDKLNAKSLGWRKKQLNFPF